MVATIHIDELTIDDLSPVDFMSQCRVLSDERGYKDGWKYYAFMGRYGRRPEDEEVEESLQVLYPLEEVFVEWIDEYLTENGKRAYANRHNNQH